MWHKTRLTQLLPLDYPIIQGPFGGGHSSAKLVATVSNAGGLGSFGLQSLSAEQILQVGKDIRSQTDKPFALNLWISNEDEAVDNYTDEAYDRLKELFAPYFHELNIPLPKKPVYKGKSFDEQFEAVLKLRPSVFSFVFGLPSEYVVTECRKAGIKMMGTATTPDEAIALENAGADIIVATGFEAGGHRVSFLRPAEESLTGTFALIPQVRDQVKIPVVAAGGIADARGIAAATMLGAEGVQIGTAFLACDESNAIAIHKQKLFSKEVRYTTLTNAFSGRMARGISNRITHDMKDKQGSMAPFPLQSYFMSHLRTAALAQQTTDVVALWSGQSAPLIRHTSAAKLFESLVKETSELFNNAG